MNGLLKYSNGWGHFIISLVCLIAGIYLISSGRSSAGISLISIVSSSWFIPNAARQVAEQIGKQVTGALPPLPPLPPPPPPVNDSGLSNTQS